MANAVYRAKIGPAIELFYIVNVWADFRVETVSFMKRNEELLLLNKKESHTLRGARDFADTHLEKRAAELKAMFPEHEVTIAFKPQYIKDYRSEDEDE